MAPGRNSLLRSGLDAVARLTYLRPGTVIVTSMVILVAAATLALSVFDAASPFDITDDGTETASARAAYGGAVGVRPDADVILIADRETAAQARRTLAGIEGIGAVRSGGPALTSLDGRDRAIFGFIDSAVEFPSDVGGVVRERFPVSGPVTAGGTAVASNRLEERSATDLRTIELLIAPVLFGLCLLIFRSVSAAVLPIALAGFSITITFGLLRALTEVVQIDVFALTMASALGTGLAIDYSLFIVARYREELRLGGDFEEAHRQTLRTAGHTIAFSSAIVAAALATLIVFPQPFLRSTGIAGSLIAIVSGLAALLVIPSALSLLSTRVESRFQLPGDGGKQEWLTVARRGLRHPFAMAGIAVATLAILAGPGLDMRLTIPDARVLPGADSARQTATRIDRDFTLLPQTQLVAVAPTGTDVLDLRHHARQDPAVVSVRELTDAGGITAIEVSARLDPLGSQAATLLGDLRAEAPAGVEFTGRTADQIDQRDAIGDRLPLIAALLAFGTFVIVFAMTGSMVLPVLLLALNVATVAAALGVTVAIFQNGALEGILGFTSPDALDISVPAISLAVVFGLTTDYGLFLLSRVSEARETATSEADAVAIGIASTGRVVTAAALLFSVAAGAFAISDLVIVKEVAIAMAAAVLIDATIVRVFLFPSVLGILGSRAWARKPM